MRDSAFPRILIAGTSGGCGKTTMMCAISRALSNRGIQAASFKCGPDFIDPLIHAEAAGQPSCNLDLLLCGAGTTRRLLAEKSAACDVALIEGARGFYDGMGSNTSACSTCHLANETQTPVVLVVGCAGMMLSVAALIQGFLEFGTNRIRAVLLNEIDPADYPVYKEIIESRTGVPVCGYLPHIEEAVIHKRHLGLVTAAEIMALGEKADLLGQYADKTVNIAALMAIAQEAPALSYEDPAFQSAGPIRVAVARDRAFCFYYEENLDLLRRLGAELVPFSPLRDRMLPEGIHGLLIGGGYPELYVRQLSENLSMRDSIRSVVQAGLPTIAECGGYMYLGRSIRTRDGSEHPMTEVLDIATAMEGRPQKRGYIRLTARRDNLLCHAGENVMAYEYHGSVDDDSAGDFAALSIASGDKWDCCVATPTLFAGFPHLYWAGQPQLAENFARACRRIATYR